MAKFNRHDPIHIGALIFMLTVLILFVNSIRIDESVLKKIHSLVWTKIDTEIYIKLKIEEILRRYHREPENFLKCRILEHSKNDSEGWKNSKSIYIGIYSQTFYTELRSVSFSEGDILVKKAESQIIYIYDSKNKLKGSFNYQIAYIDKTSSRNKLSHKP